MAHAPLHVDSVAVHPSPPGASLSQTGRSTQPQPAFPWDLVPAVQAPPLATPVNRHLLPRFSKSAPQRGSRPTLEFCLWPLPCASHLPVPLTLMGALAPGLPVPCPKLCLLRAASWSPGIGLFSLFSPPGLSLVLSLSHGATGTCRLPSPASPGCWHPVDQPHVWVFHFPMP